ncbi:uncharacterized protein [Ptychodera flava]|uniref:uncharacterized protein isoform X2 n=1 Tax=Ptychodera flava TaxID=63121 RepID=UPI003969BD6B
MKYLVTYYVTQVTLAIVFSLVFNVRVFLVAGQCPQENVYLQAVPYETRYLTSPNYPNEYPSDVSCRWVINVDTSSPWAYRIVLNILDVGLEGACSYDGIKITDGDSETSRTILEICDSVNPGSVTSTGSSIFIRFYSDTSVQDRGFRISYTAFEVGSSCPPTWLKRDEYCYKVKTNITERDIAQKRCGYDASNLVSIHSYEENYFISESFLKSAGNAWVGVLYHSTYQNYSWVDRSKYAFTNWQIDNPKSSDICTAIDLNTKLWFSSSCYEQRAYVCKKNIQGTTIVHEIPPSSIDSSSGFNFWEIPGIIIAVIVFGSIGYGFLRHCCQAAGECCDGICDCFRGCGECICAVFCTTQRQSRAPRSRASTAEAPRTEIAEVGMTQITIDGIDDRLSIASSISSTVVTGQPELTPSAPPMYNPTAPPPSYEDLTFDTHPGGQSQNASLDIVDGQSDEPPAYPPPTYDDVAADSSRA